MYEIAYYDVDESRREHVYPLLRQASGQITMATTLAAIAETADVLIVGVEDLAASLGVLERLAAESPSRQLLLLWEGADAELLLDAMRAGVRDVISRPIGVLAALDRAAERLSRTRVRTQAPGKLVTVFSLKGGIGKSTIAANLAIGLHRRAKLPVQAVDLSLPCGNLEMYLDLHPSRCVNDLLPLGNELDERLVRQAMAVHESGVTLLAGPRPDAKCDISGHSSAPLLRVLRQSPGITVVDAGSYLEEAQLAALESSDLVIVPVTPLISSVGTLPALRLGLGEIGIPAERVLPILNHAIPGSNEVPAEVIAVLMNGKPQFELPWGGADVSGSLNAGLPIAQYQANSPVGAGFERLSDDVLRRIGLASTGPLPAERARGALAWLKGLFAQREPAYVCP